MTNKPSAKRKCHICGGEVKFIAYNGLGYCGNNTDPNGCFQRDITGARGKERRKNKKRSPRKRNNESSDQTWIPSILREKTVHSSTVGVGK